ncbi:MAG: hypothetical protein M1833_007307 [Piccolia ochrophora]|nr:MAG: hypothetical protein M1833_007307 [Piccolia ochrophora]
MSRTTTGELTDDDNVGKSHSVFDHHSRFPVTGLKVGTGTLLEGAAGVKSTVNDLLHFYKCFFNTCNTQTQEASTSSKGSPFKQCPELVRGHSFLGGPYLREQTDGLGWVRCQLLGPLGRQGINANLDADLPVVGEGAPSRLCLYHQGLMPGSSTIVYGFPETTTLLVETVFDDGKRNDFLRRARDSAEKSLALVPSLNSNLDSKRVPGTRPSLSLDAYRGRYFNPIKNFFIEVSLQEDSLRMNFQGLSSQSHSLRHYHYDTFTWQMTHNEAAKRARLMVSQPPEYYLLRFGTTNDGTVDRLYWILENTHPDPETFVKET